MITVSFRLVYATLAVLASVVLLGLPLARPAPWLASPGPPPPLAHGSHLPTQAVVHAMHMDNASYASWSDRADDLWDALLPANGGAVLATNLTSGYHYWGRVAMFHQLQCLRDIRRQLKAMAGGWEASRTLMGHRGGGSDYEQLGLCFDYLRQGILCHADTTLNPVAFNSEWADGKVVDGNILWHECKDRSVLYGWAELSGLPHQSPLVKEQPMEE